MSLIVTNCARVKGKIILLPRLLFPTNNNYFLGISDFYFTDLILFVLKTEVFRKLNSALNNAVRRGKFALTNS